MEIFASVLYPVLVIGGLGLFFGAVLGFAGRIFYVKEDPKIIEIREALPGANCAGCGYSGCDAFAIAVVRGDAPVNACPVGGSVCADKIADIMGVSHEVVIKRAAYIKCAGSCEQSASLYDYVGIQDCKAVNQLAANGHKACMFGCLGNGNCFRACEFGAVEIVDGIAKIDIDKCTACGKCITACPRELIELIPVEKSVRVACNSHDNGKITKTKCQVGCIGCKICQKSCEYDAITVNNFLANIDYEKCTLCGACVNKCPTNAIEEVMSNQKI